MKRITFFFSLICCIALTSCHKSGVNLFVGDYSFKTSGEISIKAEAVIDSSNVNIPASLNVNLSSDIGQLNICSSDEKNDQVVVVFNYLNGDVVVTNGTCDGNTIEIEEFRHDFLPVSVTTLFSNNYYINVSGTGQMYDDNMIIFEMKYNGKAKIGSVTYKIKDKDVKIVAYRN